VGVPRGVAVALGVVVAPGVSVVLVTDTESGVSVRVAVAPSAAAVAVCMRGTERRASGSWQAVSVARAAKTGMSIRRTGNLLSQRSDMALLFTAAAETARLWARREATPPPVFTGLQNDTRHGVYWVYSLEKRCVLGREHNCSRRVMVTQLPKYAYFEGKIVPFEDAKVSVMTNALHYGIGAFGGMRAYWNEDEEQLFIFRTFDHLTRFLNSAKLLSMELGHTQEGLTDIIQELLRKEGWREDAYIRPLVYSSDLSIGNLKLQELTPEVTVFTLPFGGYVPNEESTHITFSSWHRTEDNSIPARGKFTGAYVNTAFIKTDATRAGYDEAVVLNRDGHVSEGSGENFFMVRNGVVVTPPITDNILEGITRRSVIELLREEMGLEVVERTIDRTEVYLAEEAFFSGSAVQVAAITHADHRPIGTGVMGPIVAELRDLFFKVVRGRVEKYRHWNTPVYEKVKAK
jgi:branched-chain amino acid aminotransferase